MHPYQNKKKIVIDLTERNHHHQRNLDTELKEKQQRPRSSSNRKKGKQPWRETSTIRNLCLCRPGWMTTHLPNQVTKIPTKSVREG